MRSSRGPWNRAIRRVMLLGAVFPLAVLVVAGLSGCSREMTAPEEQLVSILPADGATGVRVDASVVLSFRPPVNREIVERSLHLLSESAMNDSLCSVDSSTVGSMTEMMGSADMMDHMMAAHSLSGQYRWNGDGECVFTPESPLTPGTRYMIHLGREMAEMMGGATMMGHDGSLNGDMAFHFTTLEQTSHEDHHGGGFRR